MLPKQAYYIDLLEPSRFARKDSHNYRHGHGIAAVMLENKVKPIIQVDLRAELLTQRKQDFREIRVHKHDFYTG